MSNLEDLQLDTLVRLGPGEAVADGVDHMVDLPLARVGHAGLLAREVAVGYQLLDACCNNFISLSEEGRDSQFAKATVASCYC